MKKSIIFTCAIFLAVSAFIFQGCKKDDTAPLVEVKGDNPFVVYLGVNYVDPGAAASDDKDGDISKGITTSGTVNINRVGSYVVTYSVADKSGNKGEATRTFNVKNHAEFMAGNYMVHQVWEIAIPGQADTSDFMETITIDSTVNDKIWFSKFANIDGLAIPVYGEYLSGSLSVNNQHVMVGTPAVEHFFNLGSSPYVVAAGFTLNFKDIIGNTTHTCHDTYVRQ